MQMLTEEQVALFEKMEEEGLPKDYNFFETMTEEEWEEYVKTHVKITASSAGGLYPNCGISGGSCSGC